MKETAQLVTLQPKLQKKNCISTLSEARLYCKGGTDDAHFEK